MAASAIFVSRPNSHPFQDRHVSLHEPVKVGRSVARARPATNNAIYDCKVLSRNHALLWYDDGKFFLQDTKSSNGTFVNNERLSKGGEESTPHEIFSSDILQFGVDVMENSRRVTHSCIIASVQLFYPDGTEAKHSVLTPFINNTAMTNACLQSQQIYQLAQYLQESLHREQVIENKLQALQGLVHDTQEASENSWQALIDEDRLLSRIEVLENQLQMYSKNQTEETLRQELVALQEDKYNYETTAKESLRRVLQEKLDAVRKLSDLVRSLSSMEDECNHLQTVCETSQSQLQQLAEKHDEKITEITTLNDKIQEMEKLHEEEVQKMTAAQTDLELEVDRLKKQEAALEAKVESGQAENDFSTEQMMNMKARLENLKEQLGDNSVIREFECKGIQVDLVNLLDLKMLQNTKNDEDANEEEKWKELEERIGFYKVRLEDSESKLKKGKEEISTLQDELNQLKSKENSLPSSYEERALTSCADQTDRRHRETLIGSAVIPSASGDTSIQQHVQQLKEQLHACQQTAKQHRNEAEQLNIRITELESELALERTHCRQDDSQRQIDALTALHTAEMNKQKAELEAICIRLHQAKVDCEQWQIDKRELELLRARYSEQKSLNLSSQSSDYADATEQSLEGNSELSEQKDMCALHDNGNTELDSDNDVCTAEYDELAFKSRIISICSMLPVLVLILAIMLGFNPILAKLTATASNT